MIFGNMGEMMKMAREMQGQLKKVKDELAREIYEASVNGVMVKVNGEMEIKEIKIDPQIIDPNKVGNLERAVREATAKALKTAKDEASRKLKKVTGGMGLPGMF